MFRGVYQSALTLALFVAFYAVDARLMRRFDPARSQGSSRSWGWTLFSVAVALIVALQPIMLPGLGFHTDAWWGLLIQVVGLALIAGGLLLHWWARRHLRHFYSERMEFQPGQILVDTGPYAFVRHPIYTSFFLCTAGLLLVNPALPTLLLALYFSWDFPRTARKEEVLLTKELSGYEEYVAHIPPYLPRVQQILGR
jgi:protein-S-isoprenylcysteine O-methyltransferase Ste14